MKTENEDISLYDSNYSTVGTATKVLLAQLVHTNKPTFSVKLPVFQSNLDHQIVAFMLWQISHTQHLGMTIFGYIQPE